LPRFLNICSSLQGFNIRKKKDRIRQKAIAGQVVASADAFYFMPNPAAPGGADLFRAFRNDPEGRVFGTADPLVEEVDLDELPDEVTGDPDWPVPWPAGPVLVVPRRAVRSLSTSVMRGGIELELRDVRILIFTPLFRRRKMAAYLTAAGWEVEGAPSQAYQPPARGPHVPAARADYRRRKRVLEIVGVLFLLAGLGILIGAQNWIRTVLAGPAPVTLGELRRLEDPSQLDTSWVRVRFGQMEETGLGVVSSGIIPLLMGETRSRYVLIQVEDQWLIAEVSEDQAGNELVGYLSKWHTPFSQKSLEQIDANFPGRSFLPFQLDAHYKYRRECLALAGLGGFLALSGLALLLFGRRHALKPEEMYPPARRRTPSSSA
jgi:hypothetical protein